MWAMAVVSTGVMAQKKDFGYKFYGQVRTDLFYNSRSNSETVDGLFYMYPKDMAPDADGKDLNAKPDGNFYTLYTRLGVDVTGPMWGKAKTSAKVEIDFRGSGTTYSLIRIRHAYFNLDWGKICVVGRTDLASFIWRCVARHLEPEYGSSLSAFQPCASGALPFDGKTFRADCCCRMAVTISVCRSVFQSGRCDNYSEEPEFHQERMYAGILSGNGL